MRHPSVAALVVMAALGIAPLARAQDSHATSTSSSSTTSSTTTTTPAAKPMKSTSTKHTAPPKADLNAATKEQLMKQPGMTEALADKIIAARPFKSTSELMSKKVLTKAEYDKLHHHVMVKSEHVASKG